MSAKYDDLIKLYKKLTPDKADEICKACIKEIAARLLAKVIKRTPVGGFRTNKKTGSIEEIKGYAGAGTLRRGWDVNKNFLITSVGNTYTIDIVNDVEYASYVEYGHRTRNHKGWVQGQFMLTISEDEIRNTTPQILENKLNKLIGALLNDK